MTLASKLAERAIQYSDNKRHTVLAHGVRGRLGFIGGDVKDAGPFIAAAKAEDAAGINMLAELTLGQIAIKNGGCQDSHVLDMYADRIQGNLREALDFMEQTAKRMNTRGPLEYTVLHASLLAYPHPGMKEDELSRNRLTARNMLSEVHGMVINASTNEDVARLRGVSGDSDLFIDLARLWQDDSLDRTIASYQSAVSLNANEDEGEEYDKAINLRAVRTASNLGAMYQLQPNIEIAQTMYQEALSKVAQSGGKGGRGAQDCVGV